MKFAVLNGQRTEAQPGLFGACPCCEQKMISKCGEIRIWHWAHSGRLTCDPWWENETEWHRNWKGQFPVSWQEVVHRTEDGEKHIADVLTDQGYVLEFQHSYIKPEERRSREAFYKQKLIWIVDGNRRKRDRDQFLKLLEGSPLVSSDQPIYQMSASLADCALLRDWGGGDAPVFFDFGNQTALFYMLPKASDGGVYIVQASHQSLVKLHTGGQQMSTALTVWFDSLPKQVAAREHARRNPQIIQQRVVVQRPSPRRSTRF